MAVDEHYVELEYATAGATETEVSERQRQVG